MFPFSQLLLDLGNGVTTSTTGDTYEISIPSSDQDQLAPSIQLWGKLTQSGGATTPVGAFYLEGSYDKGNWFSIQITGLSTDGSNLAKTVSQAVNAPRYVRAKVVPGGGTAPTLTGRFELGANRSVKFTKV